MNFFIIFCHFGIFFQDNWRMEGMVSCHPFSLLLRLMHSLSLGNHIFTSLNNQSIRTIWRMQAMVCCNQFSIFYVNYLRSQGLLSLLASFDFLHVAASSSLSEEMVLDLCASATQKYSSGSDSEEDGEKIVWFQPNRIKVLFTVQLFLHHTDDHCNVYCNLL